KAIEEIQVAFAIKDHHRDSVRVIGRAYRPLKILRDDVLKQSRLPAAGHAEDDPLHNAHFVGPYPWLAMDVISEDYAAFLPRTIDVLPIRRWVHYHRWIAQLVFSPVFPLREHQDGETRNRYAQQSVNEEFRGLQ